MTDKEKPVAAILFFNMKPKIFPVKILSWGIYPANFNTLCSTGPTKVLAESGKNAHGGHLVFQNEAKNIPSQDFVMGNISGEFQISTYNILCSRGPTKVLAESEKKNAHGGHLVFQNEAKNIPRQDFVMGNISCEFQISTYNTLCSRGPTKVLAESGKNAHGGHLVFQNEAKNIPSQDFVMGNISCEFQISTYNTLCSRGPTKVLAESEKKMPMAAILFFKMRPKIFSGKILSWGTYPANFRYLPVIPFALEGQQKSLLKVEKTPMAAILFFKMRPKIFPGKILWL